MTMSCLRASGILRTKSPPLSLHALCTNCWGPLNRGDLGDKALLFGADGRVVESDVEISPLGSDVLGCYKSTLVRESAD